MEQLIQFIVEEGIIMIPVLYILAEVIKLADLMDHRWIPVLLTVLSIGFTPWLLGGFTPDNIVQAILVVGGAVLSHEVKKNVTDK